MMAAAAVLLPLVLTTIVSASDNGVRLILHLVLVSTPCLILHRALFTPAPTTPTTTLLRLFAKSTPAHYPEHGPKSDAFRKNNVGLIPHVINTIPSDSVNQRSLSSATYTSGNAMTNEACVAFCDSKG